MGRLSSQQRRTSTIVRDNAVHEEYNQLVAQLGELANVLYIDKNSEEFAYLMGDLNMTIFPHIKHLLCDCCRENA